MLMQPEGAQSSSMAEFRVGEIYHPSCNETKRISRVILLDQKSCPFALLEELHAYISTDRRLALGRICSSLRCAHFDEGLSRVIQVTGTRRVQPQSALH